jgi:hypothetical protein
MKRLTIAGLCLASMLVMGMALAGNASAQVPAYWLACLPGTEKVLPTKWTTNQCTEAAPNNEGAWQAKQLPVGTSDTVRLVALTLLLTDLSAGPLKEKATVRCDGTGSKGWGLISNFETEHLVRGLIIVKVAEVEKASKNCERETGPCKAGEVEKVEGADLPWKEEIYETESGKTFLSRIENDGSGEPGWKVTCNTLLGSKTDECLSEAGHPEVFSGVNRVTEAVLLVSGRFLKVHRAKCSEGGAETGEVEGLIAVLLWGGNGLSLDPS